MDMHAQGVRAMAGATVDALRSALLRDDPYAGATLLQEAGYAGGEQLYASFRSWLRARMDAEPGEVPVEEFGGLASEFFRDAGWGTFLLQTGTEPVAVLDTSDWAESDPSAGLAHPGCHLTTGMLAGFFASVGSAPIAALEVECRSAGGSRCRFLLGAGEVLTQVFERVDAGEAYEEALAAVATPA